MRLAMQLPIQHNFNIKVTELVESYFPLQLPNGDCGLC